MGLLVSLLLLLLAFPAPAAVYSWVDEDGVTHIVDDPAALPESAQERVREGREGLRDLWDESVVAVPDSTGRRRPAAFHLSDERVDRILRSAVHDLERGESARAQVALESVLRTEPGNARAHWYLALLERLRGRYQASDVHLRAFLASAGEEHESWRQAAVRKLAELDDERRLSDATRLAESDDWVDVEHPHFRVHYDAALGRTSPDYAVMVLRFLEQAHDAVERRVGTVPAEPLGVKFYGKAAYLRAHRHRFSFQTVGFFDGRIHVVSAGHPSGGLRALLFHEYTHAVFRERTGSDRPFWLNEGMAELAERAARQQPGLSRDERSLLRRRIDAGAWIPLRQLAPSFAGLDDEDARVAYLVSAAAASWIEARTTTADRARILERLGSGVSDDEVFGEVLGLTTDAVDTAVREWIRGEFAPARQMGY
ncbi:MAG: DUF4124 domain-containing protein [Myxococcota bacterium]|jgi:hypothetical protein|nr:DUF4124 domain-containing protein [bacterium]MDP6076004.1 DUF4124 domain-containing protein [Myxococcota bacterium]MDP6243362.1 DUF4124 domain-containing protein [Myxococcota bacterium]MDP7076345.1 DUF4124 domain-containing protein [Myxococcota bacterium]MDP7299983.1 DUF4124 domain-containing protein [Myxococcota bacterium]